jgi:DNA-binding NarL/FixJ family response regulator
MIKILIAEDHPLMREGIKQGLIDAPDIEVVGEVGSGPELFDSLSGGLRPDILLLDIQMPDFEIVEAVPQLQTRWPMIKILIVTAHTDRTTMRQMRDLGVDGYLAKDEKGDAVVKAIRMLANGRSYNSQQMIEVALERKPTDPSPMELRVLTLAARGLATGAIAERLNISSRTAETYVKRVCNKLGVPNRKAAIAKAVQLGLVDVLE